MMKVASALVAGILIVCVFSSSVESLLGVPALWIIGGFAVALLFIFMGGAVLEGGRAEARYENRLVRRPLA